LRSPNLGGTLTIAALLGFFAWSAVRSIGARPPEEPQYPFPKPAVDAPLAASKSTETAVLAGGCFWGVQAVFEHLRGVQSVTAGYSGGRVNSPSYELVSSGVTGHAESVSVTFDPSQISYGQILMIFFSVAHDPTQLNRQGPDDGTQYRSAVFYSTEEQQRVAVAYIAQLDSAEVYRRKIVTQVVPLKDFFRAEDYHQDYLRTHTDQPYIVFNDLPKLNHLKKQFPELYQN
jgi:peptide-methionine (S)-S-oxide reductase